MYDKIHRPYTFDSVIGHESAVALLKGASQKPQGASGAYLLHGPRGTGKTTLARIFARTVNCRAPDTCTRENPCHSCEGFLEGNHEDIVEINVADTRGIDHVREIISRNNYYPSNKYRVFIFDEAHKFTNDAQECFLKPLEEPKPTTIWIFCTTAPEKLLPTVKSRCYDIPLSLIPDENMATLLQRVANAEGFQVPEDILQAITTTSEGIARTALKHLESYKLATDQGGHLALQNFAQKLQTQNPRVLALKYVAAVISNNPAGAYAVLAMVERKSEFLGDVIQVFRACTYKTVGAEAAIRGNKFQDKVVGNKSILDSDAGKYIWALQVHLEAMVTLKSYTLQDVDVLDLAVARTIQGFR